jgi:hypothetical protein
VKLDRAHVDQMVSATALRDIYPGEPVVIWEQHTPTDVRRARLVFQCVSQLKQVECDPDNRLLLDTVMQSIAKTWPKFETVSDTHIQSVIHAVVAVVDGTMSVDTMHAGNVFNAEDMFPLYHLKFAIWHDMFRLSTQDCRQSFKFPSTYREKIASFKKKGTNTWRIMTLEEAKRERNGAYCARSCGSAYEYLLACMLTKDVE